MNDLVVSLLISIFTAILIYLTYLDEFLHLHLHSSIIAGVSFTYFFIVMLPATSNRLPEYPFHLQSFEYIFVVFGFAFSLVSEKMILQRVEKNTVQKIQELSLMEQNLEGVNLKLTNLISLEIQQETLDSEAIKEIANVVKSLNSQGIDIKNQISSNKLKIHKHINHNLRQLRYIIQFFINFFIGIIMYNVILDDLLSGIFFCFFILFMSLITHRSRIYYMFPEIKSESTIIEYETQIKKRISALSLFCVTLLGIILSIVIVIPLNLVYILFSFISGVKLFTIVRKEIPEREKGRPVLFLIGIFSFSLLILILRLIQNFNQ